MRATFTTRRWMPPVAILVLALPLATPAAAHDDSVQSDGGALYGSADVYTRHLLSGHTSHEPADSGPEARAVGFEHVSTYTFDEDGDGVIDTGVGSITDVWEHDGYAYLGTFYEPNCSRFGTRIVDVNDPANPQYVGNLPSMPNTRVNDVKVTSMDNQHFSGDLLAPTQEPCFLSKGNGTSRENKGGVVLYDVSDPANPTLLKKAYIKGRSGSDTNFGVHNTFFWEQDGRTYLGLVDDDNVRDFRILDVDSDYDTTGPEGDAIGEEGNSHVAVPAPAEDGRYVLMGDEDFAPYRSRVIYQQGAGDPVEVLAAEGAFPTPLSSFDPSPLPADLVSAGGTLCAPNAVDFSGKIALISRGDCTFQLKADNAKAQGALGMVVYNNAGDSLVLMGGDGIADFFGFFVGQSDGEALEAAVAADTTSFDVESVFAGWLPAGDRHPRRHGRPEVHRGRLVRDAQHLPGPAAAG